MALAMNYVNEVMRQFNTTVLVNQEDWEPLMKLFKLELSLPFCVLDRMTLRPVVGGFEGLQQRQGEVLAQKDQLEAKVQELEKALEQATAPPPVGVHSPV